MGFGLHRRSVLRPLPEMWRQVSGNHEFRVYSFGVSGLGSFRGISGVGIGDAKVLGGGLGKLSVSCTKAQN